MSNPEHHAASTVAPVDTSDIDAMLADIDSADNADVIVAEEESVSEFVEEPAETLTIEELEAQLGGTIEAQEPETVEVVDEAALDVALAKAEAYETHEPTTSIEDPGKAPAKKAKTDKVPSEKKAKTPPRIKNLDDLDASAFVLTTDEPADLDANKREVIGSRPGQKKIAEKFDNVLLSAAAGKPPSIFVRDCFWILDAKKTVTSGELVAALLALPDRGRDKKSYVDGTARSQVGQIMALFPVLKIADRTGMSLTLRSDSTLAELYRSV